MVLSACGFWAIGCRGCRESTPPPRPHPTSTAGSAETGTPPLLPGCQLDPTNALRLRCGFARDDTDPIEVHLTGPDGETVFAGHPDERYGEIDPWDLVEETAYDWVLVDRGTAVLDGTLVTDRIPGRHHLVVDVIVDGPTTVDRTLLAMNCIDGSTLYAIDPRGRVRWYQETGEIAMVSAFDATDRGTVVAAVGRATLLEWAWDGTETLAMTRPPELPQLLHHSVIGRDGYTLALDTTATPYPDGLIYLVDGVTRVEGGVAEHVWDVGGDLDPQGLPTADPLYWAAFYANAVDFGHENSIDVGPDGSWLLSFKHLNVVLKLDPTGAIVWWLAGQAPAVSFDAPRLTLGSSVGLDPKFEAEHHVTWTDRGTILLYDNGALDEISRVIEVVVDEVALTADVVREWPLGLSCPVQSSAFLLADDRILASCAGEHQILEIDGTGVLGRQLLVSCSDGGFSNGFIRAEPAPSLVAPRPAR